MCETGSSKLELDVLMRESRDVTKLGVPVTNTGTLKERAFRIAFSLNTELEQKSSKIGFVVYFRTQIVHAWPVLSVGEIIWFIRRRGLSCNFFIISSPLILFVDFQPKPIPLSWCAIKGRLDGDLNKCVDPWRDPWKGIWHNSPITLPSQFQVTKSSFLLLPLLSFSRWYACIHFLRSVLSFISKSTLHY